MKPLVVTGTGTEIGKTIVTAAIAALAHNAGQRVAVVKPVQTGIGDGEESDTDVVRRLSGVDDVHELVRYPEPLAPATAARRAGVTATPVAAIVDRIRALTDRDLVLVEGAGGLLVHLDAAAGTIADVAKDLNAEVLVVAAAGLGTLNAIALTCEALRGRAITCAGVIVGAWPADPDLAAQENLRDIACYANAPLLGRMAADSGRCSPADFLIAARSALAPPLGGEWRQEPT